MWRPSLLVALPIFALSAPASAGPTLLAKLVVPEKSSPAKPKVTPRPEAPRIERVRMFVAGVVDSDGGPVVLLRDEAQTRVMPIWIGSAEARAIQIALRGRDFPRPLSHDLMATFIDELGAKVVDVEVSRLAHDTFYGTAHLKSVHGRTLAVDARPSDLLALALRVDAPIYVAVEVLEEAQLELPDAVAPGAEL